MGFEEDLRGLAGKSKAHHAPLPTANVAKELEQCVDEIAQTVRDRIKLDVQRDNVFYVEKKTLLGAVKKTQPHYAGEIKIDYMDARKPDVLLVHRMIGSVNIITSQKHILEILNKTISALRSDGIVHKVSRDGKELPHIRGMQWDFGVPNISAWARKFYFCYYI